MEYNGVLVPVKKTIIMSSMPIITLPPWLMELTVLMALPAIVEVGEPAMLVIDDIPDISMVNLYAMVDCSRDTAGLRQGTFECRKRYPLKRDACKSYPVSRTSRSSIHTAIRPNQRLHNSVEQVTLQVA